MTRVLIALPTAWDARQLAAAASVRNSYDLVFAQPTNTSWTADFDPRAWVDRAAQTWAGRVQGVFSSCDYPGAVVAAALAQALGLPGAAPAAVLRSGHKLAARRIQQRVAPQATPRFSFVAPHDEPAGSAGAAAPTLGAGVGFPCFIKPVKGCFSLLAQRLEDAAALRRYLAQPAARADLDEYLAVFGRQLAAWGADDSELCASPAAARCGRGFVAEELLSGDQVTVEGHVSGGRVALLGVTDSVLHPRTGSLVRFDYPSCLEPDVQARLFATSAAVVTALGLDQTLFNVELMVERGSGRIGIIEVNPRMCGQFADLYEKVDGVHGYEVALHLATGRPPPARRGGRCAAASSVPLRVFEPVLVERVPNAADIAAAEALFPGTLVWNEVAAGQALTDFTWGEDGHSARYGVINLGGASRDDVLARSEQVQARLGYRFRKL